MRICRPGKVLLNISLGIAAGHFAMNIVRRFKAWRRHTNQIDKRINEAQKGLSSIRDSQLPGISALPIEIWGIVLEYVVLERLGDARWQRGDLANILEYRLVCQLFNKEVQRLLHRNIVLTRVPHLVFMRVFMRWQLGEKQGAALYTSLWASAMCNSARPPSRSRRRVQAPPYRITERVENCVIIATHVQPESKAPSGDSQPLPNVIRQRLWTAASTSTYCQEYVYMPSSYAQYFKTYAEGDAYLETALLVSCGFSSKSVVSAMVELVKAGKLRPYMACDVAGHIKSGRRWCQGEQDPSCDGLYHVTVFERWNCGRCGKTFDIWDDGYQHTLHDYL